jgi:iron complex transport system substrate-binding protein
MQPRRLTALLAAVLMLLVACGDEDQQDAADSPSTTPQERPARIVSLSATATEILFAIEADKQVVAVDDQSNYPPEAPKTALSGFTPNLEAIVGYDPDLVVIQGGAGDLAKGLEQAGVTVVVQPAATTIEDTYRQIRELGTITGHADEANRLVTRIRAELEDIARDLPTGAKGKRYYHELQPDYFSATSKTFIGSIYAKLGLENIADAADKDGSGYPQLSGEYILQANPDFIFLADTKCCNQTVETVTARPGWDRIAAVRNRAVVELDDDIASRWGPRIVELLREVAQAVGKLEEKG